MLKGRYGQDTLNWVLIALGILFSMTSILLSSLSPVLYGMLFMLSTLVFVLALIRIFSRNIPARQRELNVFMGFIYKIRSWFGRTLGAARVKSQQRKVYRFFTCPQCSQKLRVPKNKGKVRITCTKCGHSFIKKHELHTL